LQRFEMFRSPPDRNSQATSGPRPTGWEMLLYIILKSGACFCFTEK